MNLMAMLMPVLLALTPAQTSASLATSTSLDTDDLMLVYLTTGEDTDERTEEQRYQDRVKHNQERLKKLTSIRVSVDELTKVSSKKDPLIPGKIRMRIKPDQVKVVWKLENRRVELKARDRFIGLKYKSEFSLNSLFD